MRCEYCDCEVTTYPEDGLCTHCGAILPPKPATPAPNPAPVIQTVFVPVPQPTPAQPQAASRYTGSVCPKCGSHQIETTKRGFSWGLALLGFFLIPGWGLLLGFVGRKKPRLRCRSCKRKWKNQ